MSCGKGSREMLQTVHHELLLHVQLCWKAANKFLRGINNGMLSNTENVFYIVTDVAPNTSCFRLVSYQRKHTAKIDRLSEDR